MQIFEELDYGPEDSVPFSVLCQHLVFQDLMEKSTQHQLVVSLSPGFITILFLSFPFHFMRSKILVSINFLIAYSRPALIYTLIFFFFSLLFLFVLQDIHDLLLCCLDGEDEEEQDESDSTTFL